MKPAGEPPSQPESNDKTEPIQETPKVGEKEVLLPPVRKLSSEEPKTVVKVNLRDLNPVETTTINEQLQATPISTSRREQRESLDSLSLRSGDFEETELTKIIASPSMTFATAAPTNEEVLRECLKKLSSFGTYYFGGKLKENERHIQNFLNNAIESHSQNGTGTNSILYVCGRPGTGKVSLYFTNFWARLFCDKFKLIEPHVIITAVESQTSLVENCIKQLPVPTLTINAPSISQERGCTIWDKISNVLNIPVDNIAKRMESKTLVLVIDEIDYLIQSPQLKHILYMVSDPNCKLILIGISNEVGNVKLLPRSGNVSN